MTEQTLNAPDRDVVLLERVANVAQDLRREVEKRIVGQHHVVDGLLTALLANGHALLVGVPGLAKTLLVSTVAEALDLDFSRVQFTPDLMPTDITGTEVIEEDRSTGRRVFRFVKGPIFANIVLADEINRTPPKTQAALLQAMQEREVTAAGQTYSLDAPFFVLATQNPIEQEGTYPLPEAQLDRFMLELQIGYPSRAEEEEIAMTTTGVDRPVVGSVVSAGEMVELQQLVRRVPVAPSLVAYAVRLVRATRPDDDEAPELTRRYVAWGAGPRASQYLVLGAKARAAARGDALPSLDDVRAVAPAVLAHRVVLNFEAEADGRTTRDVVAELIDDSRSWT
ncbi:MAG: AAA family ATPase [Gemmatimonadetes bacterium]|nr:AAA family ATPase [Gemmatimonadota bacterium]NNF38848.1 AAA family ATPase [Gemmatimonadota bacterium]NNK64142.1 AAA family ATPase [Gemmatimonadota bacterium]